jgi:predicted metal-binding membrane protein
VSSAADPTSKVLRHERAIVAGGLLLLNVLCWSYLLHGAGMSAPAGTGGMTMQPPFAAFAVMWWLMMMAMMLPSATPTILLYAKVSERHANDGRIGQSWLFALGYVLIWLLFSLVAAASQKILAGGAMVIHDRRLESLLLIAVGFYQLSPLKQACLHQCRTPTAFLTRHWRPGPGGALRLGLLHGGYCLGCCGLLMVLLFVGGVMNFILIGALTLAVTVEKLVPNGPFVGRVAGVGLLLWGVASLVWLGAAERLQ